MLVTSTSNQAFQNNLCNICVSLHRVRSWNRINCYCYSSLFRTIINKHPACNKNECSDEPDVTAGPRLALIQYCPLHPDLSRFSLCSFTFCTLFQNVVVTRHYIQLSVNYVVNLSIFLCLAEAPAPFHVVVTHEDVCLLSASPLCVAAHAVICTAPSGWLHRVRHKQAFSGIFSLI